MQRPQIGLAGNQPNYGMEAGISYLERGQSAPAQGQGTETVDALLARAVQMTMASPDPKRELDAWAAAFASLKQLAPTGQNLPAGGQGIAAQALPQPSVTMG